MKEEVSKRNPYNTIELKKEVIGEEVSKRNPSNTIELKKEVIDVLGRSTSVEVLRRVS